MSLEFLLFSDAERDNIEKEKQRLQRAIETVRNNIQKINDHYHALFERQRQLRGPNNQ